ncbi:MAG: hypothetical protein V4608_01995 [Bacteroidota bacterium]
MFNSFAVKSTVLGISLLLTSITFAQKGKDKPEKNKFLEGKKFDVIFTEVKKTGTAKPLPSLMVIKSGQIQCDLMEEKLTAPQIPYKVVLDTTYQEEDQDVRKVKFTGEYTEEKTSYKWDATITDYDIEGTCVMLKGGVEKKRFDFTGQEKAKKK